MTRTDATFTFVDDQSIDTVKSNTMERNGDTNQAGIIFFGKAFQHIRVLLLRNILLHGCTLIRDSSDSPPPLFFYMRGLTGSRISCACTESFYQ